MPADATVPVANPVTATDTEADVPFAVTKHVYDTCLCFATQRAARTLARRFDAALKPVGLNNGQYSLMMALNRPEPPTLGSVAQLLAMDRTTLTAKLKPLQARGLVTVSPDTADRRGRRLALTAEGRRVLAAAVPIWRDTHAAIDADLGGGTAALRAALFKVTDGG